MNIKKENLANSATEAIDNQYKHLRSYFLDEYTDEDVIISVFNGVMCYPDYNSSNSESIEGQIASIWLATPDGPTLPYVKWMVVTTRNYMT